MLYELIPGGTIACRNGRAMQAPMPFNIRLREICHLLIILFYNYYFSSHGIRYKSFPFIIDFEPEGREVNKFNDELLCIEPIILKVLHKLLNVEFINESYIATYRIDEHLLG